MTSLYHLYASALASVITNDPALPHPSHSTHHNWLLSTFLSLFEQGTGCHLNSLPSKHDSHRISCRKGRLDSQKQNSGPFSRELSSATTRLQRSSPLRLCCWLWAAALKLHQWNWLAATFPFPSKMQENFFLVFSICKPVIALVCRSLNALCCS